MWVFGSQEVTKIWTDEIKTWQTSHKGPVQTNKGNKNVVIGVMKRYMSKRNKLMRLQWYLEIWKKWTSQTAPTEDFFSSEELIYIQGKRSYSTELINGSTWVDHFSQTFLKEFNFSIKNNSPGKATTHSGLCVTLLEVGLMKINTFQ